MEVVYQKPFFTLGCSGGRQGSELASVAARAVSTLLNPHGAETLFLQVRHSRACFDGFMPASPLDAARLETSLPKLLLESG
jgi:hypothetical protein